MYLPEDAIDMTIVAADSGYSGSSNDHYYRSMGATIAASRLLRKERAYGCQPFLRLQPHCTLTPASAGATTGTTPQATYVVIPPLRQAPTARHTRNTRNPLPEFCERLKAGSNVIVRVSEDEREFNPGEDYFIAKVEGKAKKLEEDGVHSAVMFRKNDWIVSVCWYQYVASTTTRAGERCYKKGFSQWIPCGSIVKYVSQPVILKWRTPYYRLSKGLHEHIQQHGDLYQN